MRSVLTRVMSALAAFALILAAAFAADPQGYTLSNPETGDDDLDAALRDASLLISLRSKTPTAPFALIERARGDFGRFQTVLESLGYYQGKVTVTIAGRDIADKTLPDLLEKVPQGQTVEVKSDVARGPQYTLRKISFEGEIPPGFNPAEMVGVAPGDPAIAADILGGQGTLLSALQEQGYAFANVAEPAAFADDAAHVLDLTYAVSVGSRATIGAISFQGLGRVRENFVRKTLSVRPGDLYRPSAIEAARAKLVGLGVFSAVSVRAAESAGADGTVPLRFEMQERARHAVAFSAAYSTDLGGSISASWSHRNLLGNGEHLNLSASTLGLGGTATAGLGYSLGAQFIKPRFLGDEQEFEAVLAAIKQHLDAYAQTAETFGVFLRRRFSPQWSATGGLTVMHDLVSQEDTERTYETLALPVSGAYDSTGLKDPLNDPVSGARAALSVTPSVSRGKKTAFFAVLQASGSVYIDVSGGGRSVVAARGLVGSIQGGSNFDLPPDQRLYAGGGGTVRGFRYQSIGPHFADGNPTGASSIAAVSLEFRQRVLRDYGVAAFVDAGQASEDNLPFNGSIQVGAGIGARYYTAIGAIRADVAVPVTRVPNGDKFEIYISIGQAF